MKFPPPAAAVRLRRRAVSTRIGASTGALVAALAIAYAAFVEVPHPRATIAAALVMLVPGSLFALFSPVVARSAQWRRLTGGYLAVALVALLAMIALQETVASPLTFFMVGPLVWVAMTGNARSLAAIGGLFVAFYGSVALFGDAGPAGYALVNVGSLLTVTVATALRRTAMERDQALLRHLSRTDALTGCLNRRGFARKLEAAIAAGEPFTLLAFDLDGLKQINDRDGHSAGDAVLCQAAVAIRNEVGDDAAVGRLGGDEFAALVPGLRASGDCRMASRLAAAGAAVSVGVASFPADGTTADELHAHADLGLYAAKRDGAGLAFPPVSSAAFTAAASAGPTETPTNRGGLPMTAAIHMAGFLLTAAYGAVTLEPVIAALGLVGSLTAALVHRFADRLRGMPLLRTAYTLQAFAVTFAFLVLDGGPGQPLASAFMLPVMALAMTARPRELVAIGGLLTLSFGGVMAITTSGPPGYTPLMLILTAMAAGACCAQQTEMMRQRKRLDRLSSSDELTGCLNRRGMRERLDAIAAVPGARVGLVSIDLDSFKLVNDTLGHAAGDELLRWVGAALPGCVRDGDSVGRMGGDEFTILLPDPAPGAPEAVARRIEAVLAERTGVSVGCAVLPDEVGGPTALKQLADRRMYARKREHAAARAVLRAPVTP